MGLDNYYTVSCLICYLQLPTLTRYYNFQPLRLVMSSSLSLPDMMSKISLAFCWCEIYLYFRCDVLLVNPFNYNIQNPSSVLSVRDSPIL